MWRRYKYPNTRQYKRLPVACLIRHRVMEKDESRPMVLATASDISAGGVSFTATDEVPPFSRLELEIGFPATPHPIKAIAEEVRTEPVRGAGTYKIAARFLDIDEKDRLAVDEYINEILGGNPGEQWWWRRL